MILQLALNSTQLSHLERYVTWEDFIPRFLISPDAIHKLYVMIHVSLKEIKLTV